MSPVSARERDLERRLRAAEDELAIQRLKARYAELVDARYGPDGPKSAADLAPLAERIAALFTEDALWDGGPGLGTHRGRAAIAARMRAPTLRTSRHAFGDAEIEVEGDGARARFALLAVGLDEDGRAFWLVGAEHDRYARIGGEWLHASLRLEIQEIGPPRGSRGGS